MGPGGFSGSEAFDPWLPTSSAEVKNEWSYTPVFSVCLGCMDRDNVPFFFCFCVCVYIYIMYDI